jgi:hypothetical protein
LTAGVFAAPLRFVRPVSSTAAASSRCCKPHPAARASPPLLGPHG